MSEKSGERNFTTAGAVRISFGYWFPASAVSPSGCL